MDKSKYILKEWDGVFYPNEWPEEDVRHTYWNKKGEQLSGITQVVNYAFNGCYDGVPTKVMVQAAEFGSSVHSKIEDYEKWGGDADEVITMYEALKKQYGLRHLASEFLVSENKHFASAIDQIYDSEDCAENEVLLVDIKCTADRMEEKVALQLSFYADWFEKQTGLKVKGIYHMWFRKDSREDADGNKESYVTGIEFNEVHRVATVELKKLVRAYLNDDKEYVYNPYPKTMRNLATKLNKVYQQYLEAELALKQAKEEYMTAMLDEHHRTIKSGNMSVTIVNGKKSTRFNTSKFKKEHPDMVNDYMSESVSAPYLSITFNKK